MLLRLPCCLNFCPLHARLSGSGGLIKKIILLRVARCNLVGMKLE